MRLHLRRHALPVARDEASVPDAERERSREDRVQARRVAQGIEALGKIHRLVQAEELAQLSGA